ncbi:MAG: carbohydrate kinase family protein [archaeon]
MFGRLAKPEVVGFGHILYDLRCYVENFPKPDKTSFVRGKMKGSVGGSATNVVCNLAKLGKKTAILGKVGFDENGEFALRSLRKLGVETSGVKIDQKHPTGLSIVVIDKKGQPAVVEMLGANERIEPREISFSLINSAKIVHLTGAPVRRLEEVSEYAKSLGKTVAFDPGRSISRLGYKALEKTLRNSDILIINRKEAAELGGPDRLKKLLPDKTIVIKGGKKPTILYDPKDCAFLEIGTYPVAVRDTLGSGDAFSAGFIAKLLEGEPIWQAVSYANACGALKATREGADGLPHRDEVDDFYRKHRGKVRIVCRKKAKLGGF